jgi:ubiquinone/menaquinone biosynthesis C-methylase UbiE
MDPQITIGRANECAPPIPDVVFDRAFALLVLHFLPETELAVREMCRVVRPDGVVATAMDDRLLA